MDKIDEIRKAMTKVKINASQFGDPPYRIERESGAVFVYDSNNTLIVTMNEDDWEEMGIINGLIGQDEPQGILTHSSFTPHSTEWPEESVRGGKIVMYPFICTKCGKVGRSTNNQWSGPCVCGYLGEEQKEINNEQK